MSDERPDQTAPANAQSAETFVCTNCGFVIPVAAVQYCRVDGCTEDWNARISNLGTKRIAEICTQGQRVFVDSHVPICYRCATESGYVCWHCDLRKAGTV